MKFIHGILEANTIGTRTTDYAYLCRSLHPFISHNATLTACTDTTKWLDQILNCSFSLIEIIIEQGGDWYLEQSNVQRPIFRNFEVLNTKITIYKLFNFLFSILLFMFIFFKLTLTLKIYDDLWDWKFMRFWYFY